jgi:hypothetical protein
VGVPGGDEGGAGEPAAQGQVGAGEQQQTGPADENEAVALEPVVEDVEPSGDYNVCPSTTLVTESNDDICLQLS